MLLLEENTWPQIVRPVSLPIYWSTADKIYPFFFFSLCLTVFFGSYIILLFSLDFSNKKKKKN